MSYIKKPGWPKWPIWKMTLLIPNFDPFPHRKPKGTKTVKMYYTWSDTYTHTSTHAHDRFYRSY